MADPALILLVEDESPIRKFVRASLEGEGYRLVEAETGQSALAQAASQPPDLIILDLGLPDKDGLDVLRSLREWLSAPVIVLSARGQEKDKVAALDSGADIAHRPAMLRVDHGLLPGLAAVTSQPRAIAKAAAGSAPEARFDRTAHAVSYPSRNPDARDISQ